MRWQDWLVEALRVRNTSRGFFEVSAALVRQAELLLRTIERVKKLEQFHCEHEFSDRDKGCTESIFCSKCGALHPDWKETFPHIFGFAEGEKPVGNLIVGDKHYRTKASKPKEE